MTSIDEMIYGDVEPLSMIDGSFKDDVVFILFALKASVELFDLSVGLVEFRLQIPPCILGCSELLASEVGVF